eukprot:CAMPEP_0194096258 /NCGR_PEP_ID=MMETSP0149-20130528/57244_1 /TAXON_ID=122233 /ORGANISM="Chaetoceros debilis, Strain MM31A-1" /LENGTH=1028 /DNA_ID=CAMNT_0038782227 /DNA_START=363 /DNA_END=3450 /DNA_ORIENTATION=+
MRHTHSEPQLASFKAEYGSIPPRNAELNHSHDHMLNSNVDMDRPMGTDDGESSPLETKEEYSGTDTEIHCDSEDAPLLDKAKHHDDGEDSEDRSLLEPPQLTSSKAEYGSVPPRSAELNHYHDQMINLNVDMDRPMGTDDGESSPLGTKEEYSGTEIHGDSEDGEDGPLMDKAKYHGDSEDGEDRPLLDEGKHHDDGENGEDRSLSDEGKHHDDCENAEDRSLLDEAKYHGAGENDEDTKEEYSGTEIHGDSEDGEDGPLMDKAKYHGDSEDGEDRPLLDEGKHHDDGENGEDRSLSDEAKYHGAGENGEDTKEEYSGTEIHGDSEDGEDGPLWTKPNIHGAGENGEDRPLLEPPLMSKLSISAIVSTAFSYGCIISTLFILTLPIECQRIELESTKYHMHSYTIHKSMALGGFAAIAGVTQLVTPIVGMLSDHYAPMTMMPKKHAKAAKLLGRRLPYLLLGSILTVVGAVGQFYASNPIHRNQVLDPTGNDMPLDGNTVGAESTRIYLKTVMLGGAWMEYTIFFSLCMIGINVVYTVMIALIPDLVPPSQTGVANGSLALMIVLGSLFGFGMYYEVLEGDILNMYKMYAVVAFMTGFISYASVCNRARILQQVDSINTTMKVEDRNDDMERNQPYEANIRRFTQSERTVTNQADMKAEDGNDDTEKNQSYEANIRRFTQSEKTTTNQADMKAEDGNDDTEKSHMYEANVQRFTQSKRTATNQVDIGPFDQSEAQNLIGSPQQKPHQQSSDEEFFSIFDIPSILVALFYEPIRFKSQSEIFAAYWIDITEHHDFFIVTISRFFYYMGVSSQTFFLYFIHDVLTKTEDTANAEDAVAALAIVGQIAGAITCYPIGIISDKYFGGRRKPFVFFSCFCLSLGNISLLFCTSFRQMIWVSTFSGAANGMYLTMDTSLAVDTLEITSDDDESSDHENELSGLLVNEMSSKSKEHNDDDHDGAAQLLGVWGVCGFIGSASGPVIGGIVLLLAGRNNLEPSQFYSMRGYEGVFLLSAFYYFCSAISLTFIRKKGV